ncbi:CatB-related O-acetyltransferase [Algoriphagus kandeliae]|uniref:CatB-related O-acetyltransferase n=1 Tax=Algoriphagus kandeliae TaxID=2562278 RepID=A0A4Y9R159_9BACT|nr:CatB-related O-acetyltransferase [Algoriphagus kandeliae]TFV97213.1 CatB-related O-acetyltransferase [Algoriphagus kandeliae]
MFFLSKPAKFLRKLFFKYHPAYGSSRVSLWSNGLQNVQFGGENSIPEFCVFAGQIEIGFRSTLGKNNYLIGDVTIGKYCQVGAYVAFHSSNHPVNYLTTYINSKLFDGELSKLKSVKPIVVGNDVWIGHGAIILSGVSIGHGAIIGAGSIVTQDIPPYAIAVGNPARILKFRYSPKIIEELLEFNWWDKEPSELNNFKKLFFTDLTQVESIYQVLNEK